MTKTAARAYESSADVEMGSNVGALTDQLRGADLAAPAARLESDLIQLCKKETAAIKAQERDINLYTRLIYDALLEFLNEASDVFLTLQLYKYSSDSKNQRLARGLFQASLFFLCFEFLMRTLTKVLFDFTRPWVPVGSERCQCIGASAGRRALIKRPQVRAFKAGASTFAIVLSAIVSILEPNVGSVLFERLEDQEAKDLPKAPESLPGEVKEFYELYSQEVARLNLRRELFWLFAIEDVPELIIEILLVVNLEDPDELTLIWWLSTITTLFHLFRHTLEYVVGRRLLYKLKAKLPEVFREPGQLKQVGFTVKQLREQHDYSWEKCKEAGYSLEDTVSAFDLKGTSDIARAFGLRKLERKDDSERRVGARVLCEGKLGKITQHQYSDDIWNCIKIDYDDGTKNKDNTFGSSGYLKFTNQPGWSEPTEDVWVGFPEETD